MSERTEAGRKLHLLRLYSDEAGVMPVERRGQVTDVEIESTGNRRSSISRRKAAAFKRWHEPEKSRGLCPVCRHT